MAKKTTKSNFTLTNEQQCQLELAVEAFRGVETEAFNTDLEKGKILHEAWLTLGDSKEAEACWTKWVRNDIGIGLRTAQRYRTVYSSFVGNRLSEIPEYPATFLQTMGSTKLDLVITLNNHLRDSKELPGVSDVEFCEDGIFLLLVEKGDKVRTPLSEMTVEFLRKLKPQKKRVDTSQEVSVDSETVDLRKVKAPAELRKLVKSERAQREKAEKEVVKLTSKVESLTKERDALKRKLKKYEASSTPSEDNDLETPQADDTSSPDAADSTPPDLRPAA